MLISCYECKAQMSDAATACPHCGAPKKDLQAAPVQVQVVKQKSNVIWWVLGTPVALFGAFLFLGAVSPKYTAYNHYSAAKEECEKTNRRSSVYMDCEALAQKVKQIHEGEQASKEALAANPEAKAVTQSQIFDALADGRAKAKDPVKPTEWPKPPANFNVSQ